MLVVRFSTTLDVDNSCDEGADDGRKAALNAAQELVVKLIFHHDGGVSYGDDDDDVAVANDENIALYS
jgi:hypothetical protein